MHYLLDNSDGSIQTWGELRSTFYAASLHILVYNGCGPLDVSVDPSARRARQLRKILTESALPSGTEGGATCRILRFIVSDVRFKGTSLARRIELSVPRVPRAASRTQRDLCTAPYYVAEQSG